MSAKWSGWDRRRLLDRRLENRYMACPDPDPRSEYPYPERDRIDAANEWADRVFEVAAIALVTFAGLYFGAHLLARQICGA